MFRLSGTLQLMRVRPSAGSNIQRKKVLLHNFGCILLIRILQLSIHTSVWLGIFRVCYGFLLLFKPIINTFLIPLGFEFRFYQCYYYHRYHYLVGDNDNNNDKAQRRDEREIIRRRGFVEVRRNRKFAEFGLCSRTISKYGLRAYRIGIRIIL